MKAEESSNESLGDGIRRPVGSSVSSTPENEQPPRGAFLEFEEYGATPSTKQQKPKALKIRIDEEYEDQAQPITEEQSEDSYPCEREYQSDEHLQLLIEYRENIDKLSTRVITLEERLYYYEDYNRRLLKQNEEIREDCEQHCRRLHELQRTLQGKQQNGNLQKELIDSLNKKIQYLEAQQIFIEEYAERINAKDGRLRELAKTLEKVLDINHQLEGELRQANFKIVELQKQIQRQSCQQIELSLCKIKELNGKENADGNGGYRKSLKRADRVITFKTQPNERHHHEPMEHFHFTRY